MTERPVDEPVPTNVDVAVVGAATRDVAPDDSRGWRLGGAAPYAALTLANLGLRVVAAIGADASAASAAELVLLREAGVDVRLVPLVRGPVFENVETPSGRVQHCRQASDPMPVGLGVSYRGWFFAPVADELDEAWADVPAPDDLVAIGWQGMLRTLPAGGPVSRRGPKPSRLLARANLVGVSRDDLEPDVAIDDLLGLLRPDVTLLMTDGPRGGLLVDGRPGGDRALRRYPVIPTANPVDATGAGDSFLAALFAARLEPRLVGGRGGGLDLLLAAAVASLVLEAPGLHGVPSRSAVRARMREGLGRKSVRHAGQPDGRPPPA